MSKINTKDRLGEKRMMSCGMEAEIIEYFGSNDITVRFEDGCIAKNKRYDHFQEGCIAHPSYFANERLGEKHTMNCGLEATIVAYRGSQDIDIQFEDGAIVYKKQYAGFKKGKISHPYKKITDKYLGEKRMMNCGLEAEIINIENVHNLTVRFSNGFIKSNVYYTDFKRGMVRPNTPRKECASVRLGEKRLMKHGVPATIVEYNDSENILVKFPNGHILKTTYERFKIGQVCDGTYNFDKNAILNNPERISKRGYEYKIIKIIDNNNVLVRFSNGEEKKYSLRAINSNYITPTKKYSTPKKEKRPRTPNYKYNIGDFVTNRFGLTGKIVARHGCSRYDFEINDKIITTSMSNFMHRRYVDKSIKKSQEVEEIIGETSISLNGLECEIVGGNSKNNLTIRFSDGNIKTGCHYYLFKNHKISSLSDAGSTVIDTNRNKKIGETKLSKSGLLGTIIQYKDNENIQVKLESGEIINTSYYRFTHGLFVSQHQKNLQGTSVNEYTLAYCLRDYGFSKAPKGSLKKYGFGQKELDLFNEERMIAIEYDGAIHSLKNNNLRDKNKDILCRDAGIQLIRIRERCGKLNSGMSLEILLDDCHYFSPALQNVLNELCSVLSKMMCMNVKPKKLSKHKDRIIKEYAQNTHYKKRLNQTSYNNANKKMTIIRYNGVTDIDVKFENGYIAYNRLYADFLKGNILCKENHYGEENTSRLGEKMKIISNCFGNLVDVEFPNGYIAYNQHYCDFLSGHVTNKAFDAKQRYVGQTKLCNNGLKATVIDAYKINKSWRVDVKFENGIIAKNINYGHFTQGYAKYPGENPLKCKNKNNRLGETKMMTCGLEATIITYQDCDNIDIKFEDGQIRKNIKYKSFKKGNVLHPLHSNGYLKNIGRSKLMNNGLKATIIDYNSPYNVTVSFEDGTIVNDASIQSFNKGCLSHPINKIDGRICKNKKERIGETLKMKCEMNATIIAYRRSNDIDVQFEDGFIVYKKQYGSFKKGHIFHPKS